MKQTGGTSKQSPIPGRLNFIAASTPKAANCAC
jgi:hypothetical protein